MRRKYVLVFIICLLLAGCTNKNQTEEKQIITPEPTVKSEEISIQDTDDEAGEETHSSKTDALEGQIKEQSFDVKLDGWGEVTFASFLPEENDEMNGDVRFKLLKGNDEIYSFPGITDDNCHFNQYFVSVVAVAFKDYNKDGKNDIIIINEYAPLSGPNADESYNDVRIYTQIGDEKEFSLVNNLYEFLMKNYYNDSIASVMEGIEEYQKTSENEASYYGDYRVTACKGTAAAYALSEEEIKERIGTKLSYQADTYVCNESTMDISQYGYSQELYSAEDLKRDFNIEASDLGIKENQMLNVAIQIEGEMFGGEFYVVDENTLLIYYEGVFFEADREVN